MDSRLPRPARLFWPLQLGGWLAFGVVMTLSRVGAYPLGYMAATKGTLAVLGFAVSLLLRELYRRHLRDEPSLARMVGTTVAASYAAALLWTALHNVIDRRLVLVMFGEWEPITRPAALFNGSVYHGFALLAWSVFYVAIRRHLALEEERARHLEAEALAHRARLQALRYQLQPHFLFNALNALSTLVVEERTSEASRMVSRLADFLRFTLAGSDEEEVPLEEELEFSRRYLEIEQVRFGERLHVRVEAPADVRRARVPNLLLQPLVENAVRHGVASRPGGGAITIRARRAGDVLHLEVADRGLDGAGGTGADDRSAPAAAAAGAPNGSGAGSTEGIGLANTRERLARLYGDRHRLELHAAEDGRGARVQIEIPFCEASAP